MGVSKGVLGEPSIINAMIQGGIHSIADSRIETIEMMKNAGLSAQFVLLRTALSQAESVVQYADISLNTEMATLKRLSYYARAHNTIHQVIVMVEMGDLREGVLPGDLFRFIRQARLLSHINIVGLGCNLACYGGVKPDHKNMHELSNLVAAIEQEFQFKLEIVSGGNSANYEWFHHAEDIGRVNNLRLGESILLGREALNRTAIPGLYTQAFQLVAEVIEAKQKPSLPSGDIGQDAFGNVPRFRDRGVGQRSLVALGRQDVLTSGLRSADALEILGSSSDHIILDSNSHPLRVGDEVNFTLNYGALLAAMTSPFIKKQFVANAGYMAA